MYTEEFKDIKVMYNVETIAEAEYIIDHLISILGGGFHPDTRIIDYINIATNEPTFPLEQVAPLQRLLEQTFELFSQFGEDYIYSYSMMVLKRQEETDARKEVIIN